MLSNRRYLIVLGSIAIFFSFLLLPNTTFSQQRLDNKKTKSLKSQKAPKVINLLFINTRTAKIVKRSTRTQKELTLRLNNFPNGRILVRAVTRPRSAKNIAITVTPLMAARPRLNQSSASPDGILWKPQPGAYALSALELKQNKKIIRTSKLYSLRVKIPRPKRTPTPTPLPTLKPTPAPTVEPTPTKEPTAQPTAFPTVSPTMQPTPTPTAIPTPNPPYPLWEVVAGQIIKNAKPVFPRGFYYVSYYSAQKAKRLLDVQTIAQAGYNMIHTPVDRTDQNLLDLAASLGVDVAMEFNDDPSYLLQIFNQHPALALIGTFDDVDALQDGVPRYSPTAVGIESSRLKSLAPNTLTYISGGYPTRISKYLGTADTIGYQTYPIPSEPLSSLTSAYLNPIINDFAATGQPLISNLQTFGWYGTYRFPTPTETRNMTYQALAAGVQGILYYTYFDGDTDLSNQPALWSELQLIGAELTALEPYLVSGTHQRLNTDVSELYAAKWRVGSKLVVVVINASSTSNKTLALTLNDNLSGTRRNLFAYRSNLLSLSGKTLSGTLPPESVQVYELGLL